MNEKKTAIAYVSSHHGNTKKILDAIVKGLILSDRSN